VSAGQVLRRTREVVFETRVTLFVGGNGTGKSALLEALSLACGIYIWRDPERLL
jgi:predicted ATPase